MNQTLRIAIALFFIVFFSNQIKAQSEERAAAPAERKKTETPSQKSTYISGAIGPGLTSTLDDSGMSGSGIYVAGEYVYNLSNWVGLRPYVGIISGTIDTAANGYMPGYKVNTNGLLIGGKFRITIPIPWVAPYFEMGVGASVGSFETKTAKTDLKKNVLMHTPVSMGLCFGRKTKVDVGFALYAQPSIQQTAGGMVIGVAFPIEKI